MPTLLVWGASDGLCPPDYGRDFQAAIPSAELVTVPEAGHMVPTERPRQLVELIERFVGSGDPDSALPGSDATGA
jgi:pimeloyl-ACP methyl ester carboxylesterase